MKHICYFRIWWCGKCLHHLLGKIEGKECYTLLHHLKWEKPNQDLRRKFKRNQKYECRTICFFNSHNMQCCHLPHQWFHLTDILHTANHRGCKCHNSQIEHMVVPCFNICNLPQQEKRKTQTEEYTPIPFPPPHPSSPSGHSKPLMTPKRILKSCKKYCPCML